MKLDKFRLFAKLKKIFTYLLFSKFVYSAPPQRKFLIYDKECLFTFKKYLSKNNTHVLHTRGEEFNIYLLLKNFFSFKFTLLNYFETYVEFVKPKFVITGIDNDTKFYLLKVNESVKKIMVQNAWKTETDDTVLQYAKLSKNKIKKLNFNVDHMLTFNKTIGRTFSSFINGKFYPIGSFRSNTQQRKLKNKKFDLFYISSWIDLENNRKIYQQITWSRFNKSQTDLLKNLISYAKKYNKKLYVYGKANQKNLVEKEKNYYKAILNGKNWEFIKSDRSKSYEYTDLAKIVITLNSTLGYESFVRGNKTIFFSTRPVHTILESLRFGWPSKLSKKGFFWTNDPSFNACEKIIRKLSTLSDKKWKKIVKKYSKVLMFRDNGNKKFKNICDL